MCMCADPPRTNVPLVHMRAGAHARMHAHTHAPTHARTLILLNSAHQQVPYFNQFEAFEKRTGRVAGTFDTTTTDCSKTARLPLQNARLWHD